MCNIGFFNENRIEDETPFDEELDSVVNCHFCLLPALQRDAQEEGWIPYFYSRSDIECGPACPACARKYLVLAEDKEWEENKKS